MANELVTQGNNEIVSQRAPVMQAPIYDSPQINLDGNRLEPIPESKLDRMADERSIAESRREKKRYVPLNHWNQNSKQVFEGLSQEKQRAWLESITSSEKYYNRLASDLRQQYSVLDDIAQVLAPHVKDIETSGYSLPKYLEGLINIDKLATANPVEFVLRIMAEKNMQLDELVSAAPSLAKKIENEEQISPIINKINQLEAKITQPQVQQQEGNGFTQEQLRELDQFVVNYYSQKDSSGRPLYPNAEKYLAQIMYELNYNDNVETLDDAYKVIMQKVRTAVIPGNDFKNNVQYTDDSSIEVPKTVLNKYREKEYLDKVMKEINFKYEADLR
jgi:hypothetical protein